MRSPDCALASADKDSFAHETDLWSTPNGDTAELLQKMRGHSVPGGLPDCDDGSTSTDGDFTGLQTTKSSFKAWMQRHDDLIYNLLDGQKRIETVLHDALGIQSHSHSIQSSHWASTCDKRSELPVHSLHSGVSTTGRLNSEPLVRNPMEHSKHVPPCNFESAGPETPERAKTSVALSSLEGSLDATVHWRRKIRKQHRKRRYSAYDDFGALMTARAPTTSLIYRIVTSRYYEVFCLTLLWVNAIYIAIQVEVLAARQTQLPHKVEAELVFCVVFTGELLLRVCALGIAGCLSRDVAWNMFDTFVVVIMWAEMLMALVQIDNSAPGVSVLRVIRCARIIRVARVVRTLGCFQQLRLMILSIMRSLYGVLWIVIVLFIFMFVFSICMTQGATDVCVMDHRERLDSSLSDLCRHWGSVWWSTLSLYEAMTGGISWGELLDALQPAGRFYMAIFMIYITLSVFVVSNVITGIFVESAMQAAKQDHDNVIQENMVKREESIAYIYTVFKELDSDGDAKISLEEFEEAISNETMVTYLSVLGLEIADARVLFCLLDGDRSGRIDIEEFIVGCLKLRGEARSLDMAMIQLQSDWLVEAVELLSNKVEELHSPGVKKQTKHG